MGLTEQFLNSGFKRKCAKQESLMTTAKSLHLEISNIMLVWGRRSDTKALNLVFNELFDIQITNVYSYGLRSELDQEEKLEEGNQYGLIEHQRTVSKVTEIKTRIEKCSGCEHNRSTVKKNCRMHIKFDEGWKDPIVNKYELKELRSLKSPERELIIQAELNKELKEEMLATLTRNSNWQEKKFCYYTDRSLQKDDKEKGDTVVMLAAIVQ
ncbi:1241_t:CDS:2, partial [Gigaspora margarita]